MKKLFFTALIAVSVSISAFAQDVNQIDRKVVNNFEASYGGASNVEWISKENFTVASFIQNEHKVEVFYTADGDFVATTSYVGMEELPSFAKKSVIKKYADYTVTEAFKFKADGETSYFISVENEKENVVLKVKDGSVAVYSKRSKM